MYARPPATSDLKLCPCLQAPDLYQGRRAQPAQPSPARLSLVSRIVIGALCYSLCQIWVCVLYPATLLGCAAMDGLPAGRAVQRRIGALVGMPSG